jgi:hypothetical protein
MYSTRVTDPSGFTNSVDVGVRAASSSTGRPVRRASFTADTRFPVGATNNPASTATGSRGRASFGSLRGFACLSGNPGPRRPCESSVDDGGNGCAAPSPDRPGASFAPTGSPSGSTTADAGVATSNEATSVNATAVANQGKRRRTITQNLLVATQADTRDAAMTPPQSDHDTGIDDARTAILRNQ